MKHSGQKRHFGLLPRIIVAMIAGIGCGFIFPEAIARIFVTFNNLFGNFLSFCIPLIIVGFVVPAIAEIGKRAGKMLVFTALLAYVATFFSGMFSYFVGTLTFPALLSDTAVGVAASESHALQPFFSIDIPPLMSVMTALVVAFVFGLGVAQTDVSSVLRRCFVEMREIIIKVIYTVVIPLLPFYIFGIFMNMTIADEVGPMLITFAKIILVIFAIHIAVLLLQFSVASLFSTTTRNPLKLLWRMMPAYFTALGTQSSAATIPVTLARTKALGVSEGVAGFVVPLCATIHMSGSTLKIVACALALMITQQMPYDTPMFVGFVAMLGITMVAAPGVPGGSIMAALGILSQMLGFTDADNALMIALYIAMDSFGTACNVTGDGALSVIVNRFFGVKKH